jgi:hypothetical protein
MENNIAQKVIAFAMILALPFALGAFVLAWAPAQQFHLSDPRGDGRATGRKTGKRRTQARLKMDYLDSPKLV